MTEMKNANAVKTPWHLWVIGVIATLWSAMGAVDYIMTKTKNEEYMAKFTPEQLEFFYGLPVWVVSAWAIAVWGGVLGGILLLLKKKLAVWVLLVSLIAMALTTTHNYIISNGLEVMGGVGAMMFTSAIFVVSLFLYIYARAMELRGILK
jgi:hypothetical protein